jgi:hypothetical protein
MILSFSVYSQRYVVQSAVAAVKTVQACHNQALCYTLVYEHFK